MNSLFVDNLKLILSDRYAISDRDYKVLSDILLSSEYSDEVSVKILQIVYLLEVYNTKFPISLEYFKSLWDAEFNKFKFSDMLSKLIKSNVMSVRKVKEENFFKDESINKSSSDEEGRGVYITMYSSKKFNDMQNSICSLLKERKKDIVSESVDLGKVSREVKDFVKKLRERLLQNNGVQPIIEYFTKDDIKKETSIDLVLKGADINVSNVESLAKKYIKGKFIVSVDAGFVQDLSLSLVIRSGLSSKDLFDLCEGVCAFVEAVEVG